MSIIAVKGIPFNWPLKSTVIKLAKAIKGQFEALNFDQSAKNSVVKTVYIRLSEKLDPQDVIEKINRAKFPSNTKLTAYIPDYVPDLPLAQKLKTIPLKVQKKLRIAGVHDTHPDEMVNFAHTEIMREMQYKYVGLFNLSRKTCHKLLEEIGQKILDRILFILKRNKVPGCHQLTKVYRKAHPHFGDFQLILSTLHSIQDASGEPRSQILEQELTAVRKQPYVIGNVPYKKVEQVCNKYTEKISKKVTEHVNSLNSEIEPGTDNEEMIARKKVRAELKKIAQYLPMIIRQVVTDNFVPQKSPHHKFRIYGEPFLPPKETMMPFLKRYSAFKMIRSSIMYNLLMFFVPLARYASLMAMDGTVLGGAKIVIRPSETYIYQVSDAIKAQIKAIGTDNPASFTPSQQQQQHEEAMDENINTNKMDEWNEPWE